MSQFTRWLLGRSVQLWSAKIDKLRMEPLASMPEVYRWKDAYDAEVARLYGRKYLHEKILWQGGVI